MEAKETKEDKRWLKENAIWSTRSQRCFGPYPSWPVDKDKSSQLRNYPLGKPEDYTITYLKPTFEEQGHTIGGRNTKVTVVKEKLGDLMSHRQIYLSLELLHPQTNITHEIVERCFDVFSIALKRVSHMEFVYNDLPEFSTDPFYVNYSTFRRPRREYLHDFLHYPSVSFSEKDDVGSGFTLLELIFEDKKYKIFKREWEKIIIHQQIRDILSNHFPQDIINRIFELTCKAHAVPL